MRDVLEDTPIPATSGSCDHCDRGWVQVRDAYAQGEAEKAGPPDSMSYRQRYASALSTFYPCRICRPQAFYRWANGHLDPDHDRSTCADCPASIVSTPRRSSSKRHRGYDPPPPGDGDAPELPERRDID